MKEIRIGVVGYSPPTKFDETEATRILNKAYDNIERQYAGKPKAVVSGLTNFGIPALAYREAVLRNWRTVGIACSKAKSLECFPVDEEQIIGKEWGDESSTFLKSLDVLIRVGGGKQSIKETFEFKKTGRPVFEYDLPTQ